MYDHDGNDGEVKESAVAKSTGEQDEKDMLMQDATLFRVLSSGKKISKEEAEYREYQREDVIRTSRSAGNANLTWVTKKNVM